MKISVIIPVFNCVSFFNDCIESVLNQTYRDLEIILVDDGSFDGSAELCDNFAKKDKRIQVIHQSNCGVSAARNAGMKIMTGELVSFIDADDTLDLDMYEFLVSLVKKYHVDIAHCGYRHIVGDEIRLVHDTKKVYLQNNSEALSCLVGGKLFVGSLWNKLYRTDMVKELSFDENIKINEDILFNFMAFRNAGKTVFADDSKYNYIAHKTSSACFVTPDIKKASDACEVNQYIYKKALNTSYESAAVERYMRSLSIYYRTANKNSVSQKQLKKVRLTLWGLIKKHNQIGKNMVITAWLIRFFPILYVWIYGIYDKIRKPNWEV